MPRNRPTATTGVPTVSPEEFDDPARMAAAHPEPPGIDDPVWAVGIGPGNPDYLTRRVRRTLADADVVVGFETVVECIEAVTGADRLTCGYADERETLEAFARRVDDGATGCAVFMGDPNVSGYQFLGKVEATTQRPVRVIPGISSIQIAASRARTPLESTSFVTLHKRGPLDADLTRIATDAGDRHLLILPRPYDWMPEHIAAYLIDTGAPGTLDALVLERLTFPDETITRGSLGEFADAEVGTEPDDSRFSDLSVVAVRDDQ